MNNKMKSRKETNLMNQALAENYQKKNGVERKIFPYKLSKEKQTIYMICDLSDLQGQCELGVTFVADNRINETVLTGRVEEKNNKKFCEISGAFYKGIEGRAIRINLIKALCSFLEKYEVEHIFIKFPPAYFKDKEKLNHFYIQECGFTVVEELTQTCWGKVVKEIEIKSEVSHKPMIKFELIRDIIKKINKLQGSDPNCTKVLLLIGLMFLFITGVFIVIVLSSQTKLDFEKISAIWIYSLIGLTYIFSYPYIKGTKYKIFRILFKIFLGFIFVTLCPFILALLIMYKNKMDYLVDNISMMIGCFFTSLIPITFFAAFFVSIFESTGWVKDLNSYNLTVVLIIFGTYSLSRFVGVKLTEWKKHKTFGNSQKLEMEIEGYKKAHYTMFIIMIAVLTIIFNVINIGGKDPIQVEVMNKLVKEMAACFTIFIAFDRVKKTISTEKTRSS